MADEGIRAERESDLKTVARGGTLNFAGSVVNGILQFALVVVVTQALTKSEAGAFFVAVALFIILSNTCELGADTGLTRMIPRLRVLGRIADIRRSMAVGILPGFVAGIVLAELTFFLADPLAAIFTNHQHADADRVATYIRVLAAFLPVSAAYTVSIAATRGFGTMLPNALVDRIGRALFQLMGVGAVVLAGGGAFGVALGWGIPIAVAFAIALVWLVRLITKVEHAPGERVAPTAAGGPLVGVLEVHRAARGDRRLPGHDPLDRHAPGRVAARHRARLGLHGGDAVPRRRLRRQLRDHHRDRAEALGAPVGARVRACSRRLSGRDVLADDARLASLLHARRVRAASAARCSSPSTCPAPRRSSSSPSRCSWRPRSGPSTSCS